MLAAALAGCAGAGPAADGGPDRAPAVTDLDRLRALPPISGLVHTWSPASYRISQARQRLAVACMAARGFTYRPAPPATEAEMAGARPSPFGLETLDPPPPRPAAEPPGAGERFGRALLGDQRRRITVTGARMTVTLPVDGCIAAAETGMLGADRVRWTRLRILIGEGEQDALARLEKDAEFRAATARWRECARRSGVQAPDPQAVATGLPPDADLAAEPAARIDLACKAETGYLATAYGRLAALQRQELAPAVITGWTALLARQDAVARRVLGS